MTQQANEQTKIIERDIADLSNNLRIHADNVNERFRDVHTEQQHQWSEIKDTKHILTELRLTVKGIGTSSAIYATIGSIVGSAVVTGIIGVFIVRLLG